MIDSLFPLTGFLRADARHAFQQLVWQRRREALGRWSRRRRHASHLELLLLEVEQTARRRRVGIESISLDSIIGSVEPERAVAFDRAFRPPDWSRGRWELMWLACRQGDSLPPISVYRLSGRHFVIDGHHRVSVARSLGATSIDADVIELQALGNNRGLETRPPRSRALLPRLRDHARPPNDVPPPASANAKSRELGTGQVPVRRVLFCALGLGLALLAGALAPVPAYVVILAACVFIGRGFGMPDTTGLRHHHQ
jgi:hypothetical protein